MVMSTQVKALILVGGLGARLQPITFTTPKPLLPFINKPMLEHLVEALSLAGVHDIVLAMNYKYKHIISAVERFAGRYGVKITYSLEDHALGTAGPVSLAREHLRDCTFFVMNSDVICEFPLFELLSFHRTQGLLCTILATKVDDPRKFGVIRTKGTAVVEEFVEKPREFVGNCVNAGVYVFESEALKYFETRQSSIEKEIFPSLVAMRQVGVYEMAGFWMDVGTLEGYLDAQRLYLQNKAECGRFGKDVQIGTDAHVGKYVTLGNGVSVGKRAILENCIVFEDTTIGDGVKITNSVVGKGCCIKGNVTIDSSIVGDMAKINALRD